MTTDKFNPYAGVMKALKPYVCSKLNIKVIGTTPHTLEEKSEIRQYSDNVVVQYGIHRGWVDGIYDVTGEEVVVLCEKIQDEFPKFIEFVKSYFDSSYAAKKKYHSS